VSSPLPVTPGVALPRYALPVRVRAPMLAALADKCQALACVRKDIATS